MAHFIDRIRESARPSLSDTDYSAAIGKQSATGGASRQWTYGMRGLVLATVASYGLGVIIGVRWLVPVLNMAAAYPALIDSMTRGRAKQAVARMLVWALMLGTSATALGFLSPATSGSLFVNAGPYRQEMFEWIQTGEGTEAMPRRFIPQHLVHAAVFSVLSIASGGLLSMSMGAVLMNYMGHYVGTLAAHSTPPWPILLLAWSPWALCRVASFVTLGVVLSGPLLSRALGFAWSLKNHRRLLVAAIAGLLIDVVLKTILAEPWRHLLRVWVQP